MSVIGSRIESNAFNSLSYLGTVVAPKLQFIGKSAFRDCKNLSTLELDKESLETIVVEDDAFCGCDTLTSPPDVIEVLKKRFPKAF